MVTHGKKINNLFLYWLIFSLILVFSIIIVGGLTRLTNSGLSITEWELFKGVLPPLSQSSWEVYFDLYKKIPQYQLLNSNMSLDEFKTIFYWEYFHRILGRFIGLFFLIPFLYFYFSKKIHKKNLYPCFLIFSLILLQGTVGWYMVKSGLVNDVTVSHYRLSLHLSLALIIISMIFWLITNIKKKTSKSFFDISKKNLPYLILIALIFFQIILGAFVSGLDAGKVYQTWPLMNQSYFPDDASLGNLFNLSQPSIVQFFHRNIAYLIFFLSIGVGFNIFIKKKAFLYRIFLFFFLTIITQVILGISVLITGVNLYLASMHQISSIFLIVAAINLYYRSIRY